MFKYLKFMELVLIVAKCIVNSENHFFFAESQSRINSSKVYCKLIWIPFQSEFLFCINSSKVYCKLNYKYFVGIFFFSINSSKVYCKWHLNSMLFFLACRINSSKVYCKFSICKFSVQKSFVLIVAKCIVNYDFPAMG